MCHPCCLFGRRPRLVAVGDQMGRSKNFFIAWNVGEDHQRGPPKTLGNHLQLPGGGLPTHPWWFLSNERVPKKRGGFLVRLVGLGRLPFLPEKVCLPAGGAEGRAFRSGPLNHFLLRSPAFCRPCRLAPPQHFFFFNWQLSRSEVRRLFSKCLIRYDASRARFDVRTPSIRSHSVRALTLVSRLRAADEAG